MQIYLAHSVHARPLGKEIQKEIESRGYTVYNPFYPEGGRDDIAALDQMERVKELDDNPEVKPWNFINDIEKCLQIVDMDLEAVRKSDAVVAIFPEGRTVGITCEMFFASYFLNMPVFAIVPDDMKGHPWIQALCEPVLLNIEDLYIWLDVLAGNIDIDDIEVVEDE